MYATIGSSWRMLPLFPALLAVVLTLGSGCSDVSNGAARSAAQVSSEQLAGHRWVQLGGQKEYHFFTDGTFAGKNQFGLAISGKWDLPAPEHLRVQTDGSAGMDVGGFTAPVLFRISLIGETLKLESEDGTEEFVHRSR